MTVVDWLLNSEEPWTRYRTRIDLLEQDCDSEEVSRDREALLVHQEVQQLIAMGKSWPGYALKRHNDAKHPLHVLSVLADFGIRRTDPGMKEVINQIQAHQAPEGAFETQIQLYKSFGGVEGEHWTWMACDAPELLYVLSAFGLENDAKVLRAKEHLLELFTNKGWQCRVSPLLGNFKGPGKRDDPCPIANLLTLKALSLDSGLVSDERLGKGIEFLLHHWEIQGEKKYFMFGIGTDFKRLKYPLIWYDLVHVADVLSRFPEAIKDPRFEEMIDTITAQAGELGMYTATSMYLAWKGWSFADKKNSSPWLTFLIARILKRSGRDYES
ncbi:MAG: hypothetical protein MUP11_10745 [Anaerolineales bacterium]|nr:hypothetical protein [Anaerolineales bacterium]